MYRDDAIDDAHKNDEWYDLYQRLYKLQGEHLALHEEHSMLQAEHLKWLNKYGELQKKYLALVEEDTKLTQELTASLKKQCELMDTIETLRNNILDRIDNARKNFALYVTIGAVGVLVIKFSIEFFVWLTQ